MFDSLSARRSLVGMLEVLIGMLLPIVAFGAFGLLSMWLGAETRPWFDERPVHRERPNWFPISRRLPRDDDEPLISEPPDGELVPAPAVAAPRQPPPAALTKAATSPAGV
jgi:hypothetical protein